MHIKFILFACFTVVCKGIWTEYGGTCYWLSEEVGSFEYAEQACLNMSALLMHSELGGRQLMENLDRNKQYWVKLIHDETGYFWSNGTKVERNMWAWDEPNSNQSCVRFRYIESNYTHVLFDMTCDIEYNYICETPRMIHSDKPSKIMAVARTVLIDGWSSFCVLGGQNVENERYCALKCANDFTCGLFHYNITSGMCQFLEMDTGSCQTIDFTGEKIFQQSRNNVCP